MCAAGTEQEIRCAGWRPCNRNDKHDRVCSKKVTWQCGKQGLRVGEADNPGPGSGCTLDTEHCNTLDTNHGSTHVIIVARSSKDIQRIELKPITQFSSTGRPVTRWREETLERTKFDRDTLNQEKHENVTDPTSTGKPVSGHTNRQNVVFCHPDMLKMIKQVRGNPSRWIKKRNTKLISEYQDCHTQLGSRTSLRVQELVKRIETHPHRVSTSYRLAAE